MTGASLLLAAVVAASGIRVQPQPASQGDVVVIEADAPPSGASIGRNLPTSAAGDRAEVVFFPSGARYLAIVGIDAEAKPGPQSLAVRWPDRDAAVTIEVKKRKFPTERLTVEGKYVEPPAEVTARIAAEKERLDGLWRKPSEGRLWTQPFRRPIDEVPNSAFGLQRVFNGQPRSPHNGVDFPAPAGLPVSAANAGRVALAEELYFTGNTVVVDHGLGLYTVYAHLSEIDVHPGQKVGRGDVVGKVGATGRATGPHLHWGSRLLEARVDPMQLLRIEGEESDGTSGR